MILSQNSSLKMIPFYRETSVLCSDYRQGQGKGCANRVRVSVCLMCTRNVGFKKCDFRYFVYIFQLQNSRNVLEFSDYTMLLFKNTHMCNLVWFSESY